MNGFLPVTEKEMKERGIEQFDFVYITGDAYVDHPSFGVSIISRLIESLGYTIGIISQPDWHTDKDFKRFGRPKLAFLVTSGNIDSMVAHYTAAKRKRSDDAYTAGGKAGKRPDRAVIVYCKKIREIYGDVPVAIGGLEASLRRFAHYDYWDDAVRPSILVESGADLLLDTVLCDVVCENGRIKGVITNGKSGFQYYEAKMFIDASGDSDLLHLAGVPTEKEKNYVDFAFQAKIEELKRNENHSN